VVNYEYSIVNGMDLLVRLAAAVAIVV